MLMKENPRDFNVAANIFLVFAVIRLVKESFTTFLEIRIHNMLGFPTEMYVMEIVFNILAIAAIICTMMRKRWGLIALLFVAIIEMFATIPLGGKITFAYHMGGQVAEFLITYGLFLIAMCFKTDGLSGWVSMLASEDYVRAHVKSSDKMPE